ncbi:MAG: hypothetical protein EA409_00590 [Saprospirales bacterium]|nr:MAG: hypothetical protein EA409_00590 [Saprospirales bacterium]
MIKQKYVKIDKKSIIVKASIKTRILQIIPVFILCFTGTIQAQWTITPSVGVEFAFPKYMSFNESWINHFIKVSGNPQPTLSLGADFSGSISESWSLYANIAYLRYKFDVHSYRVWFFIDPREEATGKFQNIRTCLGARYAFSDNFRMGLGVSLDYSSNFRFYNEDGERLDTEREYKITRDLGININAIRSFGKINVALQINKGLIPIVSSKRKPIMESRREIEPLSAIILTFGYGFEW